jgi:hypothetical protein
MPPTPNEPGNPTGATSLAAVVDAAARADFSASFEIEPVGTTQAMLRCSACGACSPAGDVERVWTARLEGASDPADMLHVSALRCPACGSGGVLVMNFGPLSDPAQLDVLHHLPAATEFPPAID